MEKVYTAVDLLIDYYENGIFEYAGAKYLHLSPEERFSNELTEEQKQNIEKTRQIEVENLIKKLKSGEIKI